MLQGLDHVSLEEIYIIGRRSTHRAETKAWKAKVVGALQDTFPNAAPFDNVTTPVVYISSGGA